MTFDQVRTFLLLQTAVSKPNDGTSMEFLGWREAMKSTPFPLLFNIFLASTFLLRDYLIFSWLLHTMSNLSYPKVVRDIFKDFGAC